MDEREALVRLNLSGVVGGALFRRLTEAYPLESLHRRGAAELQRVHGVGPAVARALLSAGDPRGELDLAARHGIDVLTLSSPDYPAALRTLYDPPIVLYRKGRLDPDDGLAVAVVGARDCSDYGRRQAYRWGTELASLGIAVVSGLARGIDSAAHHGALRAPRGRTVAVLGSGLLQVYPPEHAPLLDEICLRGAAFSEFPLRTAPAVAHFPRRNRLITGLSLGVLVVEAGERCGALIAADWALEQGREVFCLPGSVESPLSRGTHRLIRQGAALVEDPPDLLEELPALAGLLAPAPGLRPLERAVYRALGRRAAEAGVVAARTRLPDAAVERALQGLLDRGLARRDPAGGFVRAC